MARKIIASGATLSQLSDGYVGKLVDAALLEVCNDMDDRRDGKSRKIQIVLTIRDGGEGRVRITPEVKVTKPAMVPPETIAKLDMNAGGFLFAPDCADNPDQRTITEEVIDSETA